MGGEFERISPDPHAGYADARGVPPYAETYAEAPALDQRLPETLPLFEDALWYLEAAATPEEILVNLLTVLWTAVGMLGADGQDERLAGECEAWQGVDPGSAGTEAFAQARDQVVRDGWQLDGLARSWLTEPVDPDTQRTQAYDGLGGLTMGAAGARLMLQHNATPA
jgi:hypothetical protein